MFAKLWMSAALAGVMLLAPVASARAEGFSFDDKPKEHLDVLLDGKIVARYMDAHDTSTPARLNETYKPYLHVFDSEGKAPITKGVGGEFPHHRGIYVGWNKIVADGKTYDLWHMPKGDIVHQKFLKQEADANSATFTSQNHWEGTRGGKPILVEERTMTFRRAPAPARLLIDLTVKLTATDADVELNGDPEHAGVQFRPANEVDRSATLYVFPREKVDLKKDFDLPWIGETFSLNSKRNSVVQLNHPENPKGTRHSAYRDYGRFGSFPQLKIKAGESAVLKYAYLIADGEMLDAAAIQKAWDTFAGAKEASQVPPTVVVPAAHKAAAPKKDAAKKDAAKVAPEPK